MDSKAATPRKRTSLDVASVGLQPLGTEKQAPQDSAIPEEASSSSSSSSTASRSRRPPFVLPPRRPTHQKRSSSQLSSGPAQRALLHALGTCRRRRFSTAHLLLSLLLAALALGLAGTASWNPEKTSEVVQRAKSGSIAWFRGVVRTGTTTWGAGSLFRSGHQPAAAKVEEEAGAESDWVGGIEPDPQQRRQWARGADGARVLLADGSSFVYRNPFGGTFDADPFSFAARPQNYSKSLAEEWDWVEDRIHGVNLGGWLSLEPFITPALFDRYLDHEPEPARDEWTLSELVRADVSLGADLSGQERLERFLRQHYDEFITERDFADMAAAGLNWVRLPFPFWAIETYPGEPFLQHMAWEYVLKAVEWARKYGLRINLDLHAVPGSQNGWNHSGKLGPINFLQSAMGIVNAQRTLDYLAAVAEFCCREGVREVVGLLSVVNELPLAEVGETAARSFYAEAYERIRNITGYGAEHGPFLAIHDGFKGTRRWAHFLETQSTYRVNQKTSGQPGKKKPKVTTKVRWTDGLDRVALDSHRYLAFTKPDISPVEERINKPCTKWAADFNRTFSVFGVPISGEFSLATNDCGRFLNNVGEGTRLEGTFPNAAQPLYPAAAPIGACDGWERYDLWNDSMKATLRDFALAQMDTFQNWFYWTWKTRPSARYLPHLEANPLWSYSLGLREGWIPHDPRAAESFCLSWQHEHGKPHARRYPRRKVDGWKVGKVTGQGPIPLDVRERDRATWPPEQLNAPHGGVETSGGPRVKDLPVYEPGGKQFAPLRGPIGSRKPTGRLDFAAPRAGCAYPDAWGGAQAWDGCTGSGRE